MRVLLFVLSFLIASVPVFITVWVDRPFFAAVFSIESYKVALRELLFLSFAVSALAILETIEAGLSGHLAKGSLAHYVIFFIFIVAILFSTFRYGRIAGYSVTRLRGEENSQVWFSWLSAILSGGGAAVLKGIGG